MPFVKCVTYIYRRLREACVCVREVYTMSGCCELAYVWLCLKLSVCRNGALRSWVLIFVVFGELRNKQEISTKDTH